MSEEEYNFWHKMAEIECHFRKKGRTVHTISEAIWQRENTIPETTWRRVNTIPETRWQKVNTSHETKLQRGKRNGGKGIPFPN
jgi:hypothetical protein